jgi:outer membrane protein TolC
VTRNERARIAELDVAIASAGVAKARAAFLPVLAARGSDTLQPRDTPLTTANGSLTLTQPLIDPPICASARAR